MAYACGDRWAIIFKENDHVVMADATQMLGYFHDWRSWLNLAAAAQTGEAAEMTIYANNGTASPCKVIHIEQCTPRSTYDNPLGRPDRSSRL